MVALLTIPFKILGWIIRHPRILVLFIILIFIIFAFKACSSAFNQSASMNGGNAVPIPAAAKYQTLSPTQEQAPYVVSTGTRIYYVKQYTDKNNIVTLEQYYVYNQKTWQSQNKPLNLDRKYYGLITITKR